MTLALRPGLQSYQIQSYLLEQSPYLPPRSGQGPSRLISCSRRGTPRLIQLVGWDPEGENPGDRTPRFGQPQTSHAVSPRSDNLRTLVFICIALHCFASCNTRDINYASSVSINARILFQPDAYQRRHRVV